MKNKVNVTAVASELSKRLIDQEISPSDIRHVIKTDYLKEYSPEGMIDAIVNMTIHCLRKQERDKYAKALSAYSNTAIQGKENSKSIPINERDITCVPTIPSERLAYIFNLFDERKHEAIRYILNTIPRSQWSSHEHYLYCRLVFETSRHEAPSAIQMAKSECRDLKGFHSFIELEAVVLQTNRMNEEAIAALQKIPMNDWKIHIFVRSIRIAKNISMDLADEYVKHGLIYFPHSTYILAEYFRACDIKDANPNKEIFKELQSVEATIGLLGSLVKCAKKGLVPIEIVNMMILHARKHNQITRKDFKRLRQFISELLERDELTDQNHARSGLFKEAEVQNVQPIDRVAYRVAFNKDKD